MEEAKHNIITEYTDGWVEITSLNVKKDDEFNMLCGGTAICTGCGKEVDFICSHMVCRECCPWNKGTKE